MSLLHLFSGLLFLLLSPPANAEPLSYTQALQAAEAHAASIRQARENAALAGADLRLNDTATAMQLQGLASANSERSLASRAGPEARPLVPIVGLQLSKVLVDFGRSKARSEELNQRAAIATAAVDESMEQLRFQVARSYASYSGAIRVAAVAAEQEAVAMKRLRVLEQNFAAGMRSEGDLVAARVDLGKLRLAKLRTEAEVESVRQALAKVLGTPRAALGVPAITSRPKTPAELQSWLRAAPVLATRPLQSKQAAASAVLDASLAGLAAGERPLLSASLGLNQELGGGRTDSQPKLGAQLSLSWDIPWTGRGRQERERVGLQREALTADAATQTLALQEAAAFADDALAKAETQWQLLSAQRLLLEKQRQLLSRRYQSGRASALEMSSADSESLAAEVEQIRFSQALLLTVLDGAEARGTTSLTELFAEGAP